ncbi:hypothetical protein KQI22_11665 [Kineothrix sp. MSJ-39]|uniref:hypothetical protein n=1 Tax=Kineothrix sp. MSJ-39 TaxID=2841533 RepID=UPI001C10E819|nr:hypothetical protein [Kineothrix sp. MSJ-39]MBU5430712.1 hypothetical protein [Kineothrix sp. MSJ-39]
MSGKTTAGILTLRLCIGGYLVYLAYSLVVPLPTDTKMRVISIVFAVLFAIIGFYIALKALIRLIKKDYYDPMRDAQEEVEGSDTENAEETPATVEETEHTKDVTEQDATEKTDE